MQFVRLLDLTIHILEFDPSYLYVGLEKPIIAILASKDRFETQH